MLYSEIAEDVFEREEIEDRIPEGRKTSPLIPGKSGSGAADCFFTYGDCGDAIMLFDLIKVSEGGIEIIDLSGTEMTGSPAPAKSGNEAEEQEKAERYAQLYPMIRDMISGAANEDRERIGEFRKLISFHCAGIPENLIDRWFPEYT